MTIVEQIDRICEWTREKICSQIVFKMPDDNATDKGYKYTLVNPAAFPMYNPGRDRLPLDVTSPIPSVCVQLLNGNSSVMASTGKLNIRFVFVVWNPGKHGPDDIAPTGDIEINYVPPGESNPANKPYVTPVQPSDTFMRNGDGWRDVWNFVDVAIKQLESADILNGLQIVREEPIQFGPVTEQDSIVDFYPYWYAWLSFSVKSSVVRNNPEHQKFL